MFNDLLSLFFPERCHGCNTTGSALCSTCQKSIPLAKPLIEPARSFALYDYQNPLVQKAIWELKYHHNSPLAKRLAYAGHSLIKNHLATINTPANRHIILIAIPQHYTKTYSRGFNQSELLAKWFRAALPTTTLQPLLQKVRATDAQAQTHNRQERQKNLAQSMKVAGAIDTEAIYIIVDDVITTGSTITEASRALGAAGAKNIYAIALAHG